MYPFARAMYESGKRTASVRPGPVFPMMTATNQIAIDTTSTQIANT